MLRLNLILICTVFVFNAFSQANYDVPNGFYERKLHKEKNALVHDFVREADVLFQKRIWRVIVTGEKFNKHFVYPKEMFIQILLDATESGQVAAFDPIDDNFTTPLLPEEIKKIGRSVDTITVIDPITGLPFQRIMPQELNLTAIRKFRIKEDWFFDKHNSVWGVRIVGIAPIRERYDDNGNFLGEEPMFWVYYPHLRKVISKVEAFNIKNDAQRMTWDDVFELRYFSSYITKESNVHDRRIQDYQTGMDALLEGESIKEKLLEYEHDNWSY